jgi:hypothetical protein
MRHVLLLHPDSRCAAAAGVEVEATRPRPGALALSYLVRGARGELRLPPAAAPARTDGLWRATCFEAFVRAAGDEAYYELNFAPSTQWAAYRFSGYRTGMTAAKDISAPRMAARADADGYHLDIALELDWAPHLPGDAPWRLGLCAVLEETSGRLSYWALAHPPGRPDFHDPQSFALELPAPEPS